MIDLDAMKFYYEYGALYFVVISILYLDLMPLGFLSAKLLEKMNVRSSASLF